MTNLIVGNWKMNGLRAATAEIHAIAAGSEGADAEVVICPPVTLIAALASEAAGVGFGGQDCHPAESGAHTGDVSAEMLADAGASWCIVGHSERRADHGETDALVRAKAEATLRAGLTPIICVGETKAQREAGEAEGVVRAQLEGSVPEGDVVVAYEPVWAIGTGLTPTEDDIAAMHAAMRAALEAGTRLLYGGSVKPVNAAAILGSPDVDGALVGGASLKADDFLGIIRAA